MRESLGEISPHFASPTPQNAEVLADGHHAPCVSTSRVAPNQGQYQYLLAAGSPKLGARIYQTLLAGYALRIGDNPRSEL